MTNSASNGTISCKYIYARVRCPSRLKISLLLYIPEMSHPEEIYQSPVRQRLKFQEVLEKNFVSTNVSN